MAIIVPVCIVGGLAVIAGIVGTVFLVRQRMARNKKQGGQQEGGGCGGGGTELENSGYTQTPKSAQSEKSAASSKHTGSLEYTTSGSSPQNADTNALTCATYVEFATHMHTSSITFPLIHTL